MDYILLKKTGILIFVCMMVCATGRVEGMERAPAVLMLDTSTEQVSGARTRRGYERVAAEGERAAWKDPDGAADNIAINLLAGGGLLGAGLGDVHAQAERNASIQGLRDAVTDQDRLQEIIKAEFRRSVEAQGYEVNKMIRAQGLRAGHVARGLEKPDDGVAVLAQKAGGMPIVALSWDDRQPLLAVDMRLYTRRDARLEVSEKARRVLRYVGYEAPVGQDPREFWAADAGARFVSEVQTGLQRMLPLFWDESLDLPKVSRKETAIVQISGIAQEFPGRVWKQEEGFTFLANSDKGITIISTAGAPNP